MQRRDFIGGATLAGLGAMLSPTFTQGAHAAEGVGDRQLIEVRRYMFPNADKAAAFDAFAKAAGVPACNRAGVKTVGVLKHDTELNKGDDNKSTDRYVIMAHDSAESLLTLNAKLGADEQFHADGKDFLNAPKSDPAYDRKSVALLLSSPCVPKIEVPTLKPGRLIQFRIYESHSLGKARAKLHMFNEGGEMKIFRDVGMNPVYHGEAIAGERMPNLNYMLSFDDDDARKAGWGGFTKDPRWNTLKNDAKYADTVSKITNIFMRPVEGSQI